MFQPALTMFPWICLLIGPHPLQTSIAEGIPYSRWTFHLQVVSQFVWEWKDVFSGIGTLGLPLNVDTLKSYASTPLDQDEEEKRANVKYLIFQMKPFKRLFFQDLHFAVLNDIRTIPFEERVAVAEARSEMGELSKTVARLLVRNQEKVNFRSLERNSLRIS